MKYQVLFSLKKNEKYLRMSSAAVVIGALRVQFIQENILRWGVWSIFSEHNLFYFMFYLFL